MKGPFSRSQRDRTSYQYSSWYTTDNGQPVRKPLPYYQFAGKSTFGPSTPTQFEARNTSISYYTAQWGRDLSVLQAVDYDCYKRLVGKLGPSVQMGMNLSQLGPTIQLFKGLGGALVSPLKTAGTLMKNASKKRGGRKLLLGQVPDAYLAFQFGVLPVMQDVYNAVQIWEAPKLIRVPLLAHAHRTYHFSENRGSYAWSYDESYKVSCKRACIVSVRNPNLASLQQWGLLNPATVAWDMVPFSFVVNWFLPVGTWLSSFSDFAGFEVVDAYRTRFIRGSGSEFHRNRLQDPPDWTIFTTTRKWVRELGLISPKFPTSVNLKLGAGQVVTSGMLLLQNLKLWRL